jgi:Acyl-CoA dehydrogenase, C-terminal domain
VLGAHLALEAGDPDFARAIGTGEVDVAIAILPQAGSPRRPAYALDLTAGALLVGWTADGIGLFDSADLEGVAADECLDDSVRLDVGALDLSAARHWVSSDASSLPLRAQVLVAAASVGLAEHASDVTVEYAKTRVQFGSPIGSFQAVKHRCADMGVRWRLAWYQTCLAALKVQTGAEDAALEASAAKLVAADAAHENGRASIQVHGGIGYQSEGDAHWFMKRAHTLDQIGGSIGAQARRIARAPTAIR